VGNLDVGGLLPGGLTYMRANSIVEFPSPKGTNTFAHHVSKSTFAIFGWLIRHVRKGVGL